MPHLKKWKSLHRKPPMNEVIFRYSLHQFPGLLQNMPTELKTEFIEAFKLILFSHRHTKDDKYLAIDNPGPKFDIVRDPMYKYSKTSVEKFLENPIFQFITVFFTQNKEAVKFSESKYRENSDREYPEKMARET